MNDIEKIQRAIRNFAAEYQHIQTVRLGKLDGKTVSTGVAGQLWARQWNSKEIKVFNRALVSPIFDLRVLVGVHYTQPSVWVVLMTMEDYLTPAAAGMIGYHHTQHELGGPDVVWVNRKQITYFNVLVSDAALFKVQIYGGATVTPNGLKVLEHQVLDLSSYIPAYGAIYANLEVDADLALTVHTGDNFGSPASANPLYVPVPDSGKYILAYVLLYAGMTSLTDNLIVVPMPINVQAGSAGNLIYDDLSSQAPGTSFTFSDTPSGSIFLFFNTTFQGADTYSITGDTLTTSFTVESGDILIAIYGVTGAVGGSGAGGHVIQDEGVSLTARTNLNFIGTGVTVTDNSGADATDVTIDIGTGGGQPVAVYYQAGSHDSITDGTDGNALSIDTEWIDQDNIGHLGVSQDVVFEADGVYSIRAIVGIHGVAAFNGKTSIYLGDAYHIRTYETAENITNDLLEVGPYVIELSGGTTSLNVMLDNHLGEDISAWVYEFTIEPHQASGGGGGGSYTDEQAQDAVGAMLADTNTIDLTYTDATPELKADVKTQMSITSDTSGLKLSGDSASPGNNQVYGTNGSGVKGWKADPAGSAYTDEQAQDAIGAMIADTDTLNLTYTDATPELKGDVKTQMSVTSDTSGLKLSGDASTPGANQVYGTDGAGAKGWKADPAGYTDEQAQDAIGTILSDTDTIDATYTDATPEIKFDVKQQMSITSDSSGIKLSGDSATPGNNMVYGTNGSGVKGWKADPTGGAVDASAVTFTPSDNTQWNSSSDPGDTDDALNQLASRAKALEITASSGGAGDDVLAIAMAVAL